MTTLLPNPVTTQAVEDMAPELAKREGRAVVELLRPGLIQRATSTVPTIAVGPTKSGRIHFVTADACTCEDHARGAREHTDGWCYHRIAAWLWCYDQRHPRSPEPAAGPAPDLPAEQLRAAALAVYELADVAEPEECARIAEALYGIVRALQSSPADEAAATVQLEPEPDPEPPAPKPRRQRKSKAEREAEQLERVNLDGPVVHTGGRRSKPYVSPEAAAALAKVHVDEAQGIIAARVEDAAALAIAARVRKEIGELWPE